MGNAAAAGMMLSAAASLFVEGTTYENAQSFSYAGLHSVLGSMVGLVFIHWTKVKLDGVETDPDSAVTHLLDLEKGSTPSSKVLLLMGVMLVHSVSEGIGIGVSCHDQSLGVFVSTTLFIHNVPEGLAIAIVFLPRGVSLSKTFLWCVFSSIPQPLFAVPAFVFVESFQHVFPRGSRLCGRRDALRCGFRAVGGGGAGPARVEHAGDMRDVCHRDGGRPGRLPVTTK